jgi:hypothetical protein
MDKIIKNVLIVVIIIFVTLLVTIGVNLIPNYAKPIGENQLPLSLKWVVIFLVATIILIGVPAIIHKLYVNDYTKIKNLLFFSIFGGITGALLGEQGNLVMIIPYAILMLIYAFFYSKFTWWKVALTSYLGGVIIENVINRSPLQSPTFLWIAFFIYPYFVTKIWENRKKISLMRIANDFKFSFILAVLLALLAWYITKNNVSPPLIFSGIILPFIISVIWKLMKRNSYTKRSKK